MTRFLEFVMNHWVLWLTLVLILVLLVIDEVKERVYGLKRVKPQDLVTQLNRDTAVAVDVRDRNAYEQGHIIGSVHFPVAEIDTNLSRLEKYKDKEIVVVDGTGQAFQAATKLRKQNYKVSILSGGMNGWRTLGLPLSKK